MDENLAQLRLSRARGAHYAAHLTHGEDAASFSMASMQGRGLVKRTKLLVNRACGNTISPLISH